MKISKWIMTGSVFLSSLFLACQDAGSPARPADAPRPPEAGSVGQTPQAALEGRKMTEREVAELLAKAGPAPLDMSELTSKASATAPTGLAKTAAVTCNVNFNSSTSLSWLPDQAWDTFVLAPYYIQSCNDAVHWIYTVPKNMNHYHLGYEFQPAYAMCFGAKPKVGKQVGASCTELKEAKLWPRNAQNMQAGSGIEFYAKEGYKGAPLKLFDLKSLRILTGPAIIKVYRTDIASWWQWELPAGWWTFPYNSTKLQYLQIYHKQWDGIFSVDDIVLDVRTF